MRPLTEKELIRLINTMLQVGVPEDELTDLIRCVDSDMHMRDLMEIFRQYDFNMTMSEVLTAISKVMMKYKDMDYDEE